MVVAEALRLARSGDFGAGMRLLTSRFPTRSDRDVFTWFGNKCVEHGIITVNEFMKAIH